MNLKATNSETYSAIYQGENNNQAASKGKETEVALKAFESQRNRPQIASGGVIYNGATIENCNWVDQTRDYPNVRSSRLLFGLIIPVTNTSMESELWEIICKNPALKGVGLHTSNVHTPVPKLETEADLLEYKKQFINGLKPAIDAARLSAPKHLIMGMSLEHIIKGLKEVQAVAREVKDHSKLQWSTWHEAIKVALDKFGAKRIGLISPFDKTGNEYAKQMFEDMGFEVMASVGFSCAHANDIAHIPDEAKKKAIQKITADHTVDAIVQCGTNMSMTQVTEELEPIINIPILGINAVIFWHALRQNGIADQLVGGGRLLREF